MKHLASIIVITFFALNSFAGGLGDWIRPDRPAPYPGGGGRPNVTCSYSDDGWEEHWRGHNSCQECLSKHGNCNETCNATFTVCQAEGTDYRGYKMTLEGRGNYRYEAERQAMDLCQRSYRYGNCRITNCNDRSERVSQRRCR
ncbi:MAG: hypothetical protein KUL82_04265 [Bdellovibrio sp.]|uniref:hypothetical protein n=1 Tax=Bdellovibrio sp. TaxID=28201 RepID=UPI0039E63B05|nr:hypothetical protein [Bdellovibrio sp.]